MPIKNTPHNLRGIFMARTVSGVGQAFQQLLCTEQNRFVQDISEGACAFLPSEQDRDVP